LAANVLAYIGIGLSVALPWKGAPFLLIVTAFGSVILLVLAKVLIALPRCGVCGLWLESSSTGRRQHARLAWLTSVEQCPICSDDGLATPDARDRWRLQGRASEAPYWTRARLSLALGAIVGLPVFAYLVAEYLAPLYVASQR
jgi:hypothetical protein